MKHRHIYYFLVAILSMSFSATSMGIGFVYQCIAADGEVTLQDTACKPNTKEQIIKISKFPKESHDGLRPLELTLLERNHELDKMRKEHEYVLREQNSLAQAKYNAKRRLFDHKLKSFLFYGSRMDYPWSNGYPFGKVGHNYGGAIAGYGAPGTLLGNTTSNANTPINASDGSTSVGVVNSGSGTIGAGVGGAGGGPSGAGGAGFIINISP